MQSFRAAESNTSFLISRCGAVGRDNSPGPLQPAKRRGMKPIGFVDSGKEISPQREKLDYDRPSDL